MQRNSRAKRKRCLVGRVYRAAPAHEKRAPAFGLWLQEIKHDGFRVIARKDGAKVRLYRRPGNEPDIPLPADR